jgi:hypothetical protein
MSESVYTYDSTGWKCEDCKSVEIDEEGCQVNMKDGDPICTNCCWCPEHIADRPSKGAIR